MNNTKNIAVVGSNMTAPNESLGSPETIVAAVADVSTVSAKTLGNYPLFSGMLFPLTATKLAQIITIHGNQYVRQCIGYFFHGCLTQECRRLIPVPIDETDKNGLLRMIQTYESNRDMFPCIDHGILLAILDRSGIGGRDEDL